MFEGENKYDDEEFFSKYSAMQRSTDGLAGAGEWHTLKKMLPEFGGKRVLDLGCGFGWHCAWAAEHGAESVVGIDLSAKMIEGARVRNTFPNVEYVNTGIGEYEYPENGFDIVISSLAFHYLPDIADIYDSVERTLVSGGSFVFSVEHPVFTAYGTEDWIYDSDGNPEMWPVDRYFYEGRRETDFLGSTVVKYHRTLETYLGTLLRAGFEIKDIAEPQPTPEAVATIPGFADELRRPMMLIVSARKR